MTHTLLLITKSPHDRQGKEALTTATTLLDLPVCVSTALARGITDADNAHRHSLDGENVLPPFRLVGLSHLALYIDDDTKLIQF